MKDLRIVFMGTPDFAVATLKAIIEHKYHVVAVITAPDKPAGRGQKMSESAVKQYAITQKLPVLQPTNLKSEAFLKELKSLNANLQIVVAFRMLPEVVWRMPEYGTFNLHASLLPQYRGAAPINWVIINGEAKTGVSTFFIDDKIDTGDMILQEEVSISPEESAGDLHDKLMVMGSKLVLKTIASIEKGPPPTVPQKDNTKIKTAYKLNKDNSKIDWHQSLDIIHNHVRGLSPYPGAWCKLINGGDTLEIKIYKVEKEFSNHSLPIGHIISTKKEIRVAVANGYINIKDMKLPGKRAMDVTSLLNGYKFEADAKML